MMTFVAWMSQVVLALLGIFLIIVILLQRGRGGGLAGAFGGMGGQSAFGTKAGDVFTKITIVIAILWVGVAGGSGFFLRAAAEQTGAQFGAGQPGATLPEDEPLPEKKPAAGDVPSDPQPPVSQTAEPTGSKSAAPTGANETAPPSGTAPTTTPERPASPDSAAPASEPAIDASTPEQP